MRFDVARRQQRVRALERVARRGDGVAEQDPDDDLRYGVVYRAIKMHAHRSSPLPWGYGGAGGGGVTGEWWRRHDATAARARLREEEQRLRSFRTSEPHARSPPLDARALVFRAASRRESLAPRNGETGDNSQKPRRAEATSGHAPRGSRRRTNILLLSGSACVFIPMASN